MAPFFPALCSKRIIKRMNHQPGREIEQKKMEKPLFKARLAACDVLKCMSQTLQCSLIPAPHKGCCWVRLYLSCSSVNIFRNSLLSTSAAWLRAICSVSSFISTFLLELPVPSNLRKAQAQRLCWPLLKWKKWNKGRVWALSPTHLSEGEGRMQSQAHCLPPAPISRLQ